MTEIEGGLREETCSLNLLGTLVKELLDAAALGAGLLHWCFASQGPPPNSAFCFHPFYKGQGELGPSVCNGRGHRTGIFLSAFSWFSELCYLLPAPEQPKWEYDCSPTSKSGRYKRLNLKIHQIFSRLKNLSEQQCYFCPTLMHHRVWIKWNRKFRPQQIMLQDVLRHSWCFGCP